MSGKAICIGSAGVLALLGGALPLQAQSAASPRRTWSVKANVLPLVVNGFHLSVEKTLGPSSRHALLLTPQWYHGNVQKISSELSSDLSSDYHDRVGGYGLALQHRLYLHTEQGQNGPYVGFSPEYQHFKLQYQALAWGEDLRSNGLYYYDYRARDQHATIDRYGLSAVMGQQLFLRNSPVFIDVSFGLGYRWARRRSTSPGWQYDKNSLDYGHTGWYVPVALRLGVAW